MVMQQTSAKDNLAALTQRVAVFNVAAKIGRGDAITRDERALLRAELCGCFANNGRKYAGTFYKSAGDYARVKVCK